MSAASCLLTEDQFYCSICQDMFTDPVTTPCGHNFCNTCISNHWDINQPYRCPNCVQVYSRRPELKVNTCMSEIVSQFRQSIELSASWNTEDLVLKPGEVPCDDCSGVKLKALKSCLVCLASYCQTHLEPHLVKPGLKRHQLIDPVENLEDRMCEKHNKPLELFCKTDQMLVCILCTVLDHKTHYFGPLGEEFEEKKAELGTTEAEIQRMIQQRQQKIQEIKHSVKLSQTDADAELVEASRVYAALQESVLKSQEEFTDTINKKKKEVEKQAEGFIKELEKEISELEKRNAEVEQLSHSEDHLQLLQNFPSLSTAPPTKDWTGVSVQLPSYKGSVVSTLNKLEEMLSKLVKKAELRMAQQFAMDVTLDPDTAHPELTLSDDGKRVHHDNMKKNLPDNPERFDTCPCVLAKTGFYWGKFYFEVQVKGKTAWDLGVAKGSVMRKGKILLNPQNGFWTISLRNGKDYKALSGPPASLFLKSCPEKVGVFVDCEKGLVSFYDVGAAALIYSFTGCSFNDKFFPYFSPDLNHGGKNAAPMIIQPLPIPLVPLGAEERSPFCFLPPVMMQSTTRASRQQLLPSEVELNFELPTQCVVPPVMPSTTAASRRRRRLPTFGY